MPPVFPLKSNTNPNNMKVASIKTDEDLCAVIDELKYLLKTREDKTRLSYVLELRINQFIKENHLDTWQHSFCALPDLGGPYPHEARIKERQATETHRQNIHEQIEQDIDSLGICEIDGPKTMVRALIYGKIRNLKIKYQLSQ